MDRKPDIATAFAPGDVRQGKPRHRAIPPRKQREMWLAEQEKIRSYPMAVSPEAIAAAHRTAESAGQLISQQRRQGKDVLEELLPMLISLVCVYQPWPPAMGKNPHENREIFDRYVMLTIKCAEAVAPYQSPKAIYIRDERNMHGDIDIDLTQLSDEELQQWRALLIKARRGPTIEG
jgi:hypothetical protein